jgi:Methylamine utilisation protein MauE
MTAPAVTAPFLAATFMLGAAGVTKMARPDDTARALHTAGLPLGRVAVRVGAVGEVAVAVAAVAAPGAVTGGLVAVSYAAFATFVILALRRGWPLASCGCFGRPDTRPTAAHAGLNLGAAGVAVWWAVVAGGSAGDLFRYAPWGGWPLLLVTAVISGLAYLVWTNPLTSGAAA